MLLCDTEAICVSPKRYNVRYIIDGILKELRSFLSTVNSGKNKDQQVVFV